MLPYYTIFDQITFRVDGGAVTLFGDVRNPVLKEQAGNVVKKIEGVNHVENQIEVLPLSAFSTRESACRPRAQFMGIRHCNIMEWVRSTPFTSS